MRWGNRLVTLDHVDQRTSVTNGGTGRRPGWLANFGWRRDLALPAVLLVVQLAGATATTAGHHGQQSRLGVADWILLVVGPVALTFRHRHPVGVLWVALAATLTPSGSWSANLSLIVAFFIAATGGHRRAAWVVIVSGYICSVWLAPLVFGHSIASLQFALLLLAWLTVLVIAAEGVRMRRERSVETRAARQLDAQRRASEERLGMARDLHDVIGHNISLINVQAGVGLDLMDTHPEQARAALAAIKAVSKDALDELRTMLVALRQTDEEAPRSPTPGLDRLPELIDLTRAAGLSVVTKVTGDPLLLPAAVDLAAYRIIQESLTNVARHASPAAATVRLTYEVDSLLIEIIDNGHTAAGNGVSPGAGSGIAGMCERASALGGRLDAGSRPEGGFAVTARLPVRVTQ
jgi:signal transduction histidine kinase